MFDKTKDREIGKKITYCYVGISSFDPVYPLDKKTLLDILSRSSEPNSELESYIFDNKKAFNNKDEATKYIVSAITASRPDADLGKEGAYWVVKFIGDASDLNRFINGPHFTLLSKYIGRFVEATDNTGNVIDVAELSSNVKNNKPSTL